jgi:hypothetical protein
MVRLSLDLTPAMLGVANANPSGTRKK